MGRQVAVVAGYGSGVGILSSTVLRQRNITEIKCKYEVRDIMAVKDKVAIFILFLPEDMTPEVLCVCNYLRDICIDEEKEVYVFGREKEVERVRKIIPRLFLRKTFCREKTSVADLTDYLEWELQRREDQTAKMLMLDDGSDYLRKLRSMIEGEFELICYDEYRDEITEILAGVSVVVIDLDMKMEMKQFFDLERALYMWRNRLKVVYISGKREDQKSLNLMGSKAMVCLNRGTPPERNAAYLIRSYGSRSVNR